MGWVLKQEKNNRILEKNVNGLNFNQPKRNPREETFHLE